MSLFDALADIDELNRQLSVDHGLRDNMAEMGFIRRQGFHKDHNGALTSKWEWTDYGRREMNERLAAGLDHALAHGQERKH